MKKVRHNIALKKILGKNLYQKYKSAQNDEQLAAVYHEMLDQCPSYKTPGEPIIYAMIAYSTGVNINARILML